MPKSVRSDFGRLLYISIEFSIDKLHVALIGFKQMSHFCCSFVFQKTLQDHHDNLEHADRQAAPEVTKAPDAIGVFPQHTPPGRLAVLPVFFCVVTILFLTALK